MPLLSVKDTAGVNGELKTRYAFQITHVNKPHGNKNDIEKTCDYSPSSHPRAGPGGGQAN
jgi:hypothetical protein